MQYSQWKPFLRLQFVAPPSPLPILYNPSSELCFFLKKKIYTVFLFFQRKEILWNKSMLLLVILFHNQSMDSRVIVCVSALNDTKEKFTRDGHVGNSKKNARYFFPLYNLIKLMTR